MPFLSRRPSTPLIPARGEEPHNIVKRALMDEVLRLSDVPAGARYVAACQFGVSGPRMSDLRAKRLHRFTCDSLINMLAYAGYQTIVVVAPAERRIIGKRRTRKPWWEELARDAARRRAQARDSAEVGLPTQSTTPESEGPQQGGGSLIDKTASFSADSGG